MSDIRQILDKSIAILSIKYIWEWYRYIEQRATDIYNNSQTNRIIRAFLEVTKINFRYSFFGKNTEIKEKNNLGILDNSKFVKWLLDVYKAWEYRIIKHSRASIAFASTQEIKKELYYLPVKTVSIIVVVAILVNIFFSIFLKKKIELLGWIIRVSFLFVGLCGLFCNANWHDIKRTSLVLRYLGRRVQ